jgi:hypothetical protein
MTENLDYKKLSKFEIISLFNNLEFSSRTELSNKIDEVYHPRGHKYDISNYKRGGNRFAIVCTNENCEFKAICRLRKDYWVVDTTDGVSVLQHMCKTANGLLIACNSMRNASQVKPHPHQVHLILSLYNSSVIMIAY